MTILASTFTNALKETLEEIVTDEFREKDLLLAQWMEQGDMKDAFVDDLEVGGPGLASEKDEAQAIQLGSIREGALTRYLARTFAQRLEVSDEAIEDVKYDEVIQASKRLMRNMKKSADVDATNILVRMFDTNFVGGDGLPLGSAVHTLPDGGTFSNVLAVPMSPSRAAVIVATSQMKKFPGHDGIVEGYNPVAIVSPTEQWATWCELIHSAYAPENDTNALNVVNYKLNLKPIENKYWGNTTTNWMMLSDAPNGLKFLWRVKPASRTWADDNQGIMNYSVRARWARGWSDPRAAICVEA